MQSAESSDSFRARIELTLAWHRHGNIHIQLQILGDVVVHLKCIIRRAVQVFTQIIQDEQEADESYDGSEDTTAPGLRRICRLDLSGVSNEAFEHAVTEISGRLLARLRAKPPVA